MEKLNHLEIVDVKMNCLDRAMSLGESPKDILHIAEKFYEWIAKDLDTTPAKKKG